MIYFSELKGKPVITEDGIKVGRLIDFIFLVGQIPKITKIVFKDNNGKEQIISIDSLKKINSSIKIDKNFHTVLLEANELYLTKNILDKQIIDLNGNKVVRSNDVLIQDKDNYSITGVDIGIFGILRWLRIEKPIIYFLRLFGMKTTSNFLSWADIQPLELTRGKVKLKFKEDRLKNINPEDLADHLETTNLSNAAKILKILDERQAIEVINSLNLNYQVALFKQYKIERAASMLSLMDADEAADVLMTFSIKKREQILNNISEKKRKELIYLINLSNTQIGDAIATTFMKVRPKDSVKEVFDKIKKETIDFPVFQAIYVVNDSDQLIGVFNLHELLLVEDLNMQVYKLMIQNVIVVHLTTPLEIAIKKMLKYKVNSLPVINEKKNILGIVTIISLLNKKFENNN